MAHGACWSRGVLVRRASLCWTSFENRSAGMDLRSHFGFSLDTASDRTGRGVPAGPERNVRGVMSQLLGGLREAHVSSRAACPRLLRRGS